MIEALEVAQRHEELRERLARADGAGVRVIAVTKAFGPAAIDAAAACGIGDIGENYAQECVAKLTRITAPRRPRVHFVGRVQRNKVPMLAGCVDVWQSVDRVALVRAIARRAPGADVMIQVNISGEETKGGCPPAETEDLVTAATDAGLDVCGLMAIGPVGAPEQARGGFRTLRRMVDELGLTHCSMGMSDDLEVAVSEGASDGPHRASIVRGASPRCGTMRCCRLRSAQSARARVRREEPG